MLGVSVCHALHCALWGWCSKFVSSIVSDVLISFMARVFYIYSISGRNQTHSRYTYWHTVTYSRTVDTLHTRSIADVFSIILFHVLFLIIHTYNKILYVWLVPVYTDSFKSVLKSTEVIDSETFYHMHIFMLSLPTRILNDRQKNSIAHLKADQWSLGAKSVSLGNIVDRDL